MKPFTSKHCTPINYGTPLNHVQEKEHMHVGERTDKIKKDKENIFLKKFKDLFN